MFRKNWDLLAVIIFALLGAVIAVTNLHQTAWLSVFGFIMVLVLPGYVFSLALFSQLEFIARLLVTLAISIVLVILGGLLLNMVPQGLNVSTWIVFLLVVIGVGVLLAWRARSSQAGAPALSLPKLNLRVVLWMGLSLAFVALAIFVSQLATSRQDKAFSMLWANYNQNDPTLPLVIGVENQEGAPTIYHMVVEVNGTAYKKWDKISLENGKTFETNVTFSQPPSTAVRVLLYRSEAPDKVYRQVQIAPLSLSPNNATTSVK